MSLYYYIQNNLHRITYWDWLSQNPSAINILEQNLDKIVWKFLSKNPKPLFIKWRQNV